MEYILRNILPIAMNIVLFPTVLLFTFYAITGFVKLTEKRNEAIAYWALFIACIGAALLSIALERFVFKWWPVLIS